MGKKYCIILEIRIDENNGETRIKKSFSNILTNYRQQIVKNLDNEKVEVFKLKKVKQF